MQFSIYGLLLEHDNDFNIGPVYHGGNWDGIKPIKTTGRGALGVGAYFTPIKNVAEYYTKETGGKLLQTNLQVKNPLKIESGDASHPMVAALVQLGINREKAEMVVEKEEEKHGYMGGQVKNLAIKQGYDAIFQYFKGTLREIVIWNSAQVQMPATSLQSHP
jgi:hypothetical protein